jgi:GDP-mannose 6-dehydrogenase
VRVSVFGLGYVGCVSAASLTSEGHEVTGVDINPDKVRVLAGGESPIVEPGLADLIQAGVAQGLLRGIEDVREAVASTDISVVCVGTPSAPNGALDLSAVIRVCEQVGAALRDKAEWHVVALRSTMLPGSTECVAIPALERASGKRAGVDFGVAYNPEFLREGSALRDFRQPPRTVIGELDRRSGDVVERLYARVQAPLVRTQLRVAEMVKYADNAFHAVKVVFANEMGSLCKALGVDSHKVMDIFVLDRKLNLAPTYLKPGYAFGGSCLPKDLRAMTHRASELDVDTPLLRAVVRSNEHQKRIGFEMIRRSGRKKVGLLGLSFKQDTDDLRESPAVELCETLVGKGYDVAVYDKNVSLSTLVGSNLAYIRRELPHLSTLLRDSVSEVLDHAEVVVIANRDPEFAQVAHRLRPDQQIIDFVRMFPDDLPLDGRYEGIAW